MDRNNVLELDAIWDEARSHIESGNYDKAVENTGISWSGMATTVSPPNMPMPILVTYFSRCDSLTLQRIISKQAIYYKPEKPGYRYILGFIYSIKRQWDKAIPEFEIAVSKEPDNGEYLRGLAWAIHSSSDRARGLAYLHKASRLAPTNINILTDLAVAYLSTVNIAKAKEYAEKAVRRDSSNAVAQDVLKSVLTFDEQWQRGKGADKVRATTTASPNINIIRRFKVSLRDGPNIWRIIEIKENQMLSSLHKAIFKAFDRFEKHPYSFLISNKPYDKESEYTSPGLDTRGTRRLARVSEDGRIVPGTLPLSPASYGAKNEDTTQKRG